MPMNLAKPTASKFPLRLMPSLRKVAEDFSRQEGVCLNHFIDTAVAERLARLQHEEWLARRPKATQVLIAHALDILDHPSGRKPEKSDTIPAGYRSTRRKVAAG